MSQEDMCVSDTRSQAENLTERQKTNWKDSLNTLTYAYNFSCSEVTVFFFLVEAGHGRSV